MKTLFSKLEDNIFSGILVKKGFTRVTDKAYAELNATPQFKAAEKAGLISLLTQPALIVAKSDFDSMSYAELKNYVTANKITVASMKKVDILTALKGE